MASSIISHIIQTLRKAGINYVCAGCGALLYYTGSEGAFEGGEPAFPSKQPYEVVDHLKSCPSCGRQLNAAPDPDLIKVTNADLNKKDRTTDWRQLQDLVIHPEEID